MTDDLLERLRQEGDQPAPMFELPQPGDPLELFAVDTPPPPAPQPARSPDQRRQDRQSEAIARGAHPLSVALNRHIPLHDHAATARDGAGLRCGGCVFREVIGHHGRSYAKCANGDGARISRGAGTDLRAWWPACRDYQARP